MWPELDTHSRPRNDPEGPVCCGVGMPRPDVGSRGGGEGVQDNLPLGMEPGSLRRKKGGSCHISGKALPFRTGDRNSSGWRGWGHGHAPMWERGPGWQGRPSTWQGRATSAAFVPDTLLARPHATSSVSSIHSAGWFCLCFTAEEAESERRSQTWRCRAGRSRPTWSDLALVQ